MNWRQKSRPPRRCACLHARWRILKQRKKARCFIVAPPSERDTDTQYGTLLRSHLTVRHCSCSGERRRACRWPPTRRRADKAHSPGCRYPPGSQSFLGAAARPLAVCRHALGVASRQVRGAARQVARRGASRNDRRRYKVADVVGLQTSSLARDSGAGNARCSPSRDVSGLRARTLMTTSR